MILCLASQILELTDARYAVRENRAGIEPDSRLMRETARDFVWD